MTSLILSLAAGVASALMFASLLSGAVISILLFYLAPLPLMVVALGWSAPHAAIGGLAAGSGLGVLFGLPYLLAFVVAIVLPACWLGYLAHLGRPASEPKSNSPAIEWNPPGRLLLWVVVLSVITASAALLTLGSDAAEIRESLRRGLSRVIGTRGTAIPAGDKSTFLEAFVSMAPAAAAIVATMTLTLNLFLAGRITRTSGKLLRDWPDISQTALPPMTLVALPLALAFCNGDTLFAMVAQIVAGALMMAYAFTGLATIHALTKGRTQRGLWLGALYAALMVFGWPIVGLVALGLTDAFFGLRQRARPALPPSI
jgi:hypothetical protein